MDDEASIARLLKLVIERNGPYEVRIEHAALPGLSAAREFKPDLILMDLMMPGMSGSEAAAQLRQDPELRSIPLLFLTGAVREAAEDGTAPQIGGHRCLVKPLDTGEVLGAIQRVFGDGPTAVGG